MILEQIKSIKSGKRELRHFGLIMAVVLGIIGGYLWWRGGEYYAHLLVAAAFFGLAGWVIPVLLMPFHKIWMTISIILGWFMTRLILVCLFYLVVTPTGLLAKLFGKKFLQWQFDSEAKSYWVLKRESSPDKKVYERQF